MAEDDCESEICRGGGKPSNVKPLICLISNIQHRPVVP